MMKTKWDHFYKKTYQQRLDLIAKEVGLSADQLNKLGNDSTVSRNLIENFLTDYPLPEGVVTNLKVNGQEHLVPMVTEEPSVIAAASNGSKLLASGTGIKAEVLSHLIGGQIVIKDFPLAKLTQFVDQHRPELFAVANGSHPHILQYGGGAQKVGVRKLDEHFTSVDLAVDPGEAMGANTINTMLEAAAAWLQQKLAVTVTMAILTNFEAERIVQVNGTVPFSALETQSMSGETVAKRIADASRIAEIDHYRAATHNKGIMNGIDAAVIAFGNDWRAVESAAHSYAAKDGHYRGLSQWSVSATGLAGHLTIPMPIGYVGGATKVLPLAKINQQIAQVTNVREEMKVIAAVGLAQNLAALKALVTDGIQKGHMNLQLNSLAMANGATREELPVVVDRLKKMKQPDSTDVKQILRQLRR